MNENKVELLILKGKQNVIEFLCYCVNRINATLRGGFMNLNYNDITI